VTRLVLVLVLLAAIAAPVASASERNPSIGDLEGELMCPTCKGETLEESSAPAADRIRHFIAERIKAGDTKSEIKAKLVKQFGVGILAAPSRHGFDLLAWLLPLVGVGGGAVVIGLLVWRWSRSREPAAAGAPELNGRPPLGPELEHRLDEELARFD
jgi:cytochrome c-type biogenesis protein CcmH